MLGLLDGQEPDHVVVHSHFDTLRFFDPIGPRVGDSLAHRAADPHQIPRLARIQPGAGVTA